MENTIELSYNENDFSLEFEKKVYMFDTLKGCSEIIDKINNIIDKNKIEYDDDSEELIDYFKKVDFNKDFDAFSPVCFYAVWIDKMLKYADIKIETKDKELSDYFWDSFPTSDELYDKKFVNHMVATLFCADIDEMHVYSKAYAYSHFEEICKKAFEKYDDSKNEHENVLKLIEDLFKYIWDRYLSFIKCSERIPNIMDQSVEEENKAYEKKINAITDNKKHSNTMNIINIVIPGILLAPLACGAFSDDGGAFIVLLIIDFIWLIVGIALSGNTCKKCGKYNAYVVKSEDVIDTYPKTKMLYRTTPSGRNESYEVQVTIDKIEQTLCCTKCGDIQYKIIEREK